MAAVVAAAEREVADALVDTGPYVTGWSRTDLVGKRAMGLRKDPRWDDDVAAADQSTDPVDRASSDVLTCWTRPCVYVNWFALIAWIMHLILSDLK